MDEAADDGGADGKDGGAEWFGRDMQNSIMVILEIQEELLDWAIICIGGGSLVGGADVSGLEQCIESGLKSWVQRR